MDPAASLPFTNGREHDAPNAAPDMAVLTAANLEGTKKEARDTTGTTTLPALNQ